MNYAEKIKQSREALLMTQSELTAELGVNSITVCRWETGKTEPSIKAKKAFRNLCERKSISFSENNG
ncbi:MAG: multiprotein-bridging factor 1 family protein [Eubacteriales bacterium]